MRTDGKIGEAPRGPGGTGGPGTAEGVGGSAATCRRSWRTGSDRPGACRRIPPRRPCRPRRRCRRRSGRRRSAGPVPGRPFAGRPFPGSSSKEGLVRRACPPRRMRRPVPGQEARPVPFRVRRPVPFRVAAPGTIPVRRLASRRQGIEAWGRPAHWAAARGHSSAEGGSRRKGYEPGSRPSGRGSTGGPSPVPKRPERLRTSPWRGPGSCIGPASSRRRTGWRDPTPTGCCRRARSRHPAAAWPSCPAQGAAYSRSSAGDGGAG